jgi:arylsulfatase
MASPFGIGKRHFHPTALLRNSAATPRTIGAATMCLLAHWCFPKRGGGSCFGNPRYRAGPLCGWQALPHRRTPSAQPQNVGFDDYYGILTSSDDYTAWREPWRNPDLVNDPVRRAWAAEGETMAIVEGHAGEAAKPAFPIDLDSIRYVDEKLTDKATDFIASRAKQKNPFFLYFCTRGAHFDNYPHPKFAGKSPGRYPYRDVIVELDYRVGQVVEALRASGQLENTIILLASDNGPFAETFPDMGHTPFRSAKGSAYEGGVRTPMIASWPGVIAPGRVSHGHVDLKDVFASSH